MDASQLSSLLDSLTETEQQQLLIELRGAREELERVSSDKYVRFKKTYRDHPDKFVLECIDWDRVKASDGPAEYQLDILRDLVERRRVSARGPHGLGKTALEAWTLLWFVLTRDGEDWKAITTASAWRQLSVYLWPEIHKWAGLLRWDVIGREPFVEKRELLDLQIKLNKKIASAVASNDHEKIEGAHADSVLVLFDESKTVPDETFDAIEGAMSTGECYAMAVSTPGAPQGRFFEIQTRQPGYEDWHVRHVTLEESIEAGRINEEWVEQRKKQWGEDSAIFKNRACGEFAESATDGVIPLAWVEAAITRWQRWDDAGRPGTYIGVGADIGESDDPTVLAGRWSDIILPQVEVSGLIVEKELKVDAVIEELDEHRGLDTMASVTQVTKYLKRRNHATYCVVDAIGIGSGVVSRLRELGHQTIAFVSSQGSDRKDGSGELGFKNKRAEAWWNLREMLDPSGHFCIALPPDDLLIGELTAPRFREVPGPCIQVESKDDVKRRLNGRSTDRADAVIMIMNERPVTGFDYRSGGKRRYEPRSSVWRK